MRPTCIIVEHDPWEIHLLRLYAERLGLRPIQAHDGGDALRLACIEQPDVIILDADLPGAPTGAELLAALKQDGRTRDIPVIWLSWADGEGFSIAPISPTGYLKKPATGETLEMALTQAGVRLQ